MAFQNTRPSIAREDFEYAQEVIRKLSEPRRSRTLWTASSPGYSVPPTCCPVIL